MTNPAIRTKLERFALTPSLLRDLREEFQLALEGCDFREATKAKAKLQLGRSTPGVYFWLARAWGKQYRLYVGQTKSLSYRLSNYLSPFQPNATNDFKLRICSDLIVREHPEATFDLYFAQIKGIRSDSPRLRSELRDRERLMLDKYGGAFVNQRGAASLSAKERLRAAYEEFYRENLLSLPDESYEGEVGRASVG